MPSPIEDLRSLLEDLTHPESRRRRHLRRRLSECPDALLLRALGELLCSLMIDGDPTALWPFQLLLEEAQRRTEEEGSDPESIWYHPGASRGSEGF